LPYAKANLLIDIMDCAIIKLGILTKRLKIKHERFTAIMKQQDKKEQILLAAKTLFYEDGFTNTTIKKIAQKSEVPVSTVHYYFQTKDTIIRSIYYDFIEAIDSFLYQNKPEIFTNQILSHAVSSRIYYDIILNNEYNRRVYYEVLQHNSNYGILDTYADKIYRQYIKDNNIIITDELLNIYTHMNFGARREFFIQYFNGNLSLSVQDLVTVINGLIPRLFKLDQNLVDRLMLDSILIFDTLDYDEFKFLI
jgi:AcrR family transcriptional regulator